ncbi:hypothetical protein ES705_32494 [subsurface metagenome]
MQFLRLIDRLSQWLGRVSSFLIIAMTLLICYEVVARYIFNRPTIWAHEASAMVFGTYFVLGGGLYPLY